MKSEPEMPDAYAPDSDLMSLEAFKNHADDNPKLHEQFVRSAKHAFAGGYGELPAEMLAKARGVIGRDKGDQIAKLICNNAEAFKRLVMRLPPDMSVEDRLACAKELMDEITDALLEVSEPDRTVLLKAFLPLREQVHAFCNKQD